MPGPEEYKDLYFEEKFKRVYDNQDVTNSHLEEVCENITELFDRLRQVEDNQKICPINKVISDVKDLKETTDDIKYYKKNPWQLKWAITGLVFFFILNSLILFKVIKDLFNQ